MSSAHHHRAHVQREGLRRARAEMFEMISEAISSGRCNPSGRVIGLIEEIVEKSFRFGIEAEADALQPEFGEMTLRIAELEGQLSGIPSRPPFFQRQQEAINP